MRGHVQREHDIIRELRVAGVGGTLGEMDRDLSSAKESILRALGDFKRGQISSV